MNNDDGLFWRCCKIGMWSEVARLPIVFRFLNREQRKI